MLFSSMLWFFPWLVLGEAMLNDRSEKDEKLESSTDSKEGPPGEMSSNFGIGLANVLEGVAFAEMVRFQSWLTEKKNHHSLHMLFS